MVGLRLLFALQLISRCLAELQRTLLEVSFRVMPFDRFVTAIDQNILTLTEEFVTRIIFGKKTRTPARANRSIVELDDDPKSYAVKEQLILMLPNVNSVSTAPSP